MNENGFESHDRIFI